MEVAGLKAKDRLIYDTSDGPSFEFLVEQGKSNGLTGDAVYQAIIDDASRTSAEYNAVFSQGKK